jgi:hypothetical protein
VTATNSWPTSLVRRKLRTIFRWQHLLNREHPTGTERKSLTKSADGRVATEAAWLNRDTEKINAKNYSLLTWTGLLMEGVG